MLINTVITILVEKNCNKIPLEHLSDDLVIQNGHKSDTTAAKMVWR